MGDTFVDGNSRTKGKQQQRDDKAPEIEFPAVALEDAFGQALGATGNSRKAAMSHYRYRRTSARFRSAWKNCQKAGLP